MDSPISYKFYQDQLINTLFKYPTHLTLYAGSKVKYINLALTKSIFNVITVLCMQTDKKQ